MINDKMIWDILTIMENSQIVLTSLILDDLKLNYYQNAGIACQLRIPKNKLSASTMNIYSQIKTPRYPDGYTQPFQYPDCLELTVNVGGIRTQFQS